MHGRQKAAEAARERAVTAVDKLKGCMVDLLHQHSSVNTAPELLDGPSGILTLDMSLGDQPGSASMLMMGGSGGSAVKAETLGMGMGWSGMDSMDLAGMGLLDGVDPLMGFGSMDCGASLMGMMQDGMLHGGFGVSAEMIECQN